MTNAVGPRWHWEEWLPGKVADLRKQGRLNEDLQGAANLAQAEIEHLMKRGYQEQEAREVALRKFILLPPEPGVDGLDEEQREERAQMEREYQKNPPGLPVQDEEEYARDMMMKSPSDSQPSSPSPAESLKPIQGMGGAGLGLRPARAEGGEGEAQAQGLSGFAEAAKRQMDEPSLAALVRNKQSSGRRFIINQGCDCDGGPLQAIWSRLSPREANDDR